jgi:hypothetical protein
VPVAIAATLVLDDSHDFQGTIIGLTENPDEDVENHVDLKDLKYIAGHMSAHYHSGVVTVSQWNRFRQPESFRKLRPRL